MWEPTQGDPLGRSVPVIHHEDKSIYHVVGRHRASYLLVSETEWIDVTVFVAR